MSKTLSYENLTWKLNFVEHRLNLYEKQRSSNSDEFNRSPKLFDVGKCKPKWLWINASNEERLTHTFIFDLEDTFKLLTFLTQFCFNAKKNWNMNSRNLLWNSFILFSMFLELLFDIQFLRFPFVAFDAFCLVEQLWLSRKRFFHIWPIFSDFLFHDCCTMLT